MTNNNEEKCMFCQAFDKFELLLAKGEDFKDAFHSVLEDFAEGVYGDGFDNGFVSGLQLIRDNADKIIEKVEGYCDCDECKAERERNGYS